MDFTVRTVLNLTGSPRALGFRDWDVILTPLVRVFARYRSTRVEFHGVRDSVPEVLVISPRGESGAPVHCVFTERHYAMAANLRTLAVAKLPPGMSRVHAARNVFLRLAADYLLQQGAHGDAARLYCASWLAPAGDANLALDAGLFETFFADNPILESVLVECGWPLAHELGHALADSNAEVSSLLPDLLAQYIQRRFGEEPPASGPPGAHAKLLTEISADWFGAELLLRSIGGRTIDTQGLFVLLGEFATSIWIMALMESCKDIVRLACTAPDAARSESESLGGPVAWMCAARNHVLFESIWRDLHEAFGSAEARTQFESLIRRAMNAFRSNYEDMFAGLALAERAMLNGPSRQLPHHPLLQGLNPRVVEKFWDPMFRHLTPSWARQSEMFQGATREFINRARGTHNFRNQPADLIDHLDRLVPDDIPQLTRRRLRPDEIDKSGIPRPQ